MALLSLPLDAFLITVVAVIVPWSYMIVIQPKAPSDSPWRKALSVVLVFHSAFMLYRVLVEPPTNIFTRLHAPLGVNVDRLRAYLSGVSDTGVLPDNVEALLSRLSSFEVRTLYVRFGHDTIQNCDYCRSFMEYAFNALPRPLLEYVREIALMGLLTIRGTHRERWRTGAVASVLAGGCAEFYYLLTAHITIPRQENHSATAPSPYMWHDNFWLLRHAFFAVAPLIVHYVLPATNPATSAAAAMTALPITTSVMERLASRFQLYRQVHAASAREPTLAENSQDYWAEQRKEGAWGRDDEEVKKVAEKMGVGYGEVAPTTGSDLSPLRANVREVVGVFREMLKQS